MTDRQMDHIRASSTGHALRIAQHLAAIVDNSRDAIVSKDLAGPIVTWNDAATRMYGYTAAEAVGQPIDIVIPHDEKRRAEELGIRASIARGERIDHYETVRRHKSGTLIEVSLSISPVRDETGSIVGAAGIARDRASLTWLETEPREASPLERIIDHTIHDFKTPMQNILMNAQEAARLAVRGDQMARLDELLRRIVANSVWLNKRSEGLLRAATVRTNRQGRWTVDAGRTFDESYSMLRSVHHFVDAAIVHRGDLPEVASDEVLLGFLFQSLLQNACRPGRTGEPVVVSVTAERYQRGWRFAIRHNGPGVRPDLVDQIFEPFERNPHTDVDATRIGLSFCRRIVEWHGGRIWAESEHGHGATLWFTIPDISSERPA